MKIELCNRYQEFERGATALSAESFTERKTRSFEKNIDLVIYGITPSSLTAVLAKLTDTYGDADAEVYTENTVERHSVSTITAADIIIIRGAPFTERTRYDYGDLIEILARLRDPDGCKWDRAQTHQSIRTNIIEEAYELVEAIDLNDRDKMLEESGDVVLQGLFNAAISEDIGEFTVNDAISALAYKLVSRHTHIFGENKAENAAEALLFWEKAKAKEKGQKTVSMKMDSVPVTFGGLMRAQKVQKIAAKAGFDFPSAKDSLAKYGEELEEFCQAKGEDRESEAGDLLFAVINTLRLNGIDCEAALNRTNEKFVRRFKALEKMAIADGRRPEECTAEELDVYYKTVKREEKK